MGTHDSLLLRGTLGPRYTRSRADASGSFASRHPLAKRAPTTSEEPLSLRLTLGFVESNEDDQWRYGPRTRRKTRLSQEKRRAVSSLLAMLITVVVAVIASVAVSGFVFGTLFQSSHASQIVVVAELLPASAFTTGGSTTTFACASTSSGAYLTLLNSGSGRAVVAGVTITWAGTDDFFRVSGACAIGASGSTTATSYLIFPTTTKITPSAVTGQPFSGTVALSNGAQLLFTGMWV